MSKSIWCIIFYVLAAHTAAASIPGNSAPVSEKRVTFKKVLEFTDEGESFFFKYPDNPYQRGIQLDDEENIYILDSDRIFKFDRKGKFKKDLTVYGQGPGEVNRLENFMVLKDRVVIFNTYPSKIILKDKEGRFIKEFRLEKELDKLLAFYEDRYYFSNYEYPPAIGSSAKTIDINHYLFAASQDGRVDKIDNCVFPIKTFIARGGGGTGAINLADLLWVNSRHGCCYISHTPEYAIYLLDLKRRGALIPFKREYERQEPPEEVAKKLNRQAFGFDNKVYRRPAQKYLNDIQQLLVYKDKLWVVTSAVDAGKGVLVDEFSARGKYLANFYLKLSERVDALDYFFFYAYIFADHLYTLERDDDDNPYLVKYRISIK